MKKRSLQDIVNILLNNGYLGFLPTKIFLKLKYRIRLNKKLNIDYPQTFNEKLQWLKIYNKKDKYTIMVDKYEAKKYVANKIGEEYIIPTFGVWKNFDEINFSELPEQFVLKCTHDSGGLVICRDKKEFDIEKAKTKINKSLKRNYYYSGREWPYKNIKPRIIAEKYMQKGNCLELKDYKFYCFNGEPRYLYVSEGLENHHTASISFLDMNFEKAPFGRSDYKQFEILPEKPKKFEEMKDLARILSKDIIFLRVDFYEIEGKIYFGELTFCPCSGFMPFDPPEYDKILGDMLKLPSEKKEEK